MGGESPALTPRSPRAHPALTPAAIAPVVRPAGGDHPQPALRPRPRAGRPKTEADRWELGVTTGVVARG